MSNETPGSFPAYADAVSGNATFPDIPVYSFDPLIIPAPVGGTGAEVSTPMDVRFGGANIGAGFDRNQVERIIKEYERDQSWQMVMLGETGVNF